jgi:hypothetical protein
MRKRIESARSSGLILIYFSIMGLYSSLIVIIIFVGVHLVNLNALKGYGSASKCVLPSRSQLRKFTSFRRLKAYERLYTGILMSNMEDSNESEEEPLYDVLNAPKSGSPKPTEGYLNTDFSKVGGEKQSRVLAYIALAIAPCLLLVPFFMSRDFVPPSVP